VTEWIRDHVNRDEKLPLVIEKFKENEKSYEPLKYSINADKYAFHENGNDLFYVQNENEVLYCLDMEQVRVKYREKDNTKEENPHLRVKFEKENLNPSEPNTAGKLG
jgi:hypothetical protein